MNGSTQTKFSGTNTTEILNYFAFVQRSMELLEEAVRMDMLDPIEPDIVERILSTKPFLKVDGGFNVRDISDPKYTGLKPGYAFRSGSFEHLTEQGKQDIVNLGIKTLVDLRSPREIAASPDPVIEGVDINLAPTDPHGTKDTIAAGLEDLASIYMRLLETEKPCLRILLSHVRDFPDRPFLMHCTAGKDRTGIAAALILALGGLPSDYISREYALTRLGIEPMREYLNAKLPTDFKSSPIFMSLIQCKAECMLEMLQKVDERYGGVDRYVKQELDFTDEDVDKIIANLKG